MIKTIINQYGDYIKFEHDGDTIRFAIQTATGGSAKSWGTITPEAIKELVEKLQAFTPEKKTYRVSWAVSKSALVEADNADEACDIVMNGEVDGQEEEIVTPCDAQEELCEK